MYRTTSISSVIGKFIAYSYGKTSHKLPKNCAQCVIMLLSLNWVMDTLNFRGMVIQNMENDAKILKFADGQLATKIE